VKPTVVLERVATPLGEMSLSRHDRDYKISVAGIELMNSRDHRSEDAIGRIACEAIDPQRTAPRVLIGGLGLGYTLRAALDAVPAGAHVDVAELVPAVVRWNREIFGELARHPLADPRTGVFERDVGRVIAEATQPYDAIILDVDNGPDGIATVNTPLYRKTGIADAVRALVPGGIYAVWSSFDSPTFTRWLRDEFAHVDIRRIKTRAAIHWIWLARKH
jgi:spermidine synthase